MTVFLKTTMKPQVLLYQVFAAATRGHGVLRLALILLILGGVLSCRRHNELLRADGKPHVIFSSSPAATSPQLPWLAAAADGSLDAILSHERQDWQNQQQLLSSLLAGSCHIWLGHLDGFARARNAGAPIRVLAISGWRKWAILSRHRELNWAELARQKQPFVLPSAPPSSPGQLLLEQLLAAEGIVLRAEPHEPKQLMLKLLSKRVDTALLPEPMLSAMLAKDPTLSIIATVEELYVRQHGGDQRVPWAGFAIHDQLIAEYPELPAKLAELLTTTAEHLTTLPSAQIAAVWPDELCEFVPRDMLVAALPRELILVKKAYEVEDEIKTFLAMVNPDLPYDPALLWRP